MKLSHLVLFIGITDFLFLDIFGSFSSCRKIYEKKEFLKKSIQTEVFLRESFKNSLDGYGFSDLNCWQKSCRAMFNLDYIAWCNAEDFMTVNYEKSAEELFYGKWSKSNFDGEIYYRNGEIKK